MVIIDKSGVTIPAILNSNGLAEAQKNIADYNAGIRHFAFKKVIYGDPEVKKALVVLQHDKCCFCERKISAGEPGHIEHYRPKGGFKMDEVTRIIRPGYYWLAYDFGNLYLSCNRCNVSHKKNYFPLRNEANRATNHTMNISLEEPLIIDPATDPKPHLIYKQEMIKPKSSSFFGRQTIKRTGLNRKALVEDRLIFLEPLKILADVARFDNGPRGKKARTFFKTAGKIERPFSYMINCNFPDLV